MLGLGMVFAGGGEDALHMNLLESPSSRSLCPPLPPKPHLYPPTAAATFAYKRKQTTAFKLAYFMAWPTLGSAALWVLMPDQQQMEKVRGRPGAGSWDVGPHWRLACSPVHTCCLPCPGTTAPCCCLPLPNAAAAATQGQRVLAAAAGRQPGCDAGAAGAPARGGGERTGAERGAVAACMAVGSVTSRLHVRP